MKWDDCFKDRPAQSVRNGPGQEYMNPQRLDLLCKGFRQAFNCKFRGRVIARTGKAYDPADHAG